MFGNSLTHPSIMMRREIILKEGGYDPEVGKYRGLQSLFTNQYESTLLQTFPSRF
jgi:hypothetical protein